MGEYNFSMEPILNMHKKAKPAKFQYNKLHGISKINETALHMYMIYNLTWFGHINDGFSSLLLVDLCGDEFRHFNFKTCLVRD